ncbi:hypothetical protein RJ639_011773 [Escallonia herrerae]|uniref:PITH domain-containing protein n=1 Tax=Escallonia herrerae TaxID=1293975 RepID=A0AA88VN37_9ASTE|nr:hypothetical protein RJ639_011773 [Escallonia herrerae]
MSAESTASAIQRSQVHIHAIDHQFYSYAVVDLLDFIDWTGVECLNQSPTNSFPNALKQAYTSKQVLFKPHYISLPLPPSSPLKLEQMLTSICRDRDPQQFEATITSQSVKRGTSITTMARNPGYREDEGLNLESDADEQLLIYIPFTQVVKLHSIVVKGPEEEVPENVSPGSIYNLRRTENQNAPSVGASFRSLLAMASPLEHGKLLPALASPPENGKLSGPKTVKLYSNKEHMGFSNVNDFPPSDTAVLSEDNFKGKPVILKYVKFQNVRSLTIFIEDNQSGSDITKVQKIGLYGSTVETTDMKGLKKIEDH